ncbi:hypothetical protein RKD37_002554 [Streptomyces ambofaciens]
MSVRSAGNARAGRLEKEAGALRESAGAGAVAGNLTSALFTLSGPVPVPVIPLLTFRGPGCGAPETAAGSGCSALRVAENNKTQSWRR